MAADDPRSWMWAEACAMIERADRLHREFFRPGSEAAPVANWEPPLDIFETERELWIIAALPGVELADLDVSVDGDVLFIAGQRRLPAAGARGGHSPPGDSPRPLRAPHQAACCTAHAQPLGAGERMSCPEPDETGLTG